MCVARLCLYLDQTAFTFSWAWYLVVRFLPNLFAAEAIIVFTFQWVTVKTIVDFQKYSSEYRDKRVTRLRAAEALLLMALPILMAILLIKDVQSVPAGQDVTQYDLLESMRDLSIVMLSLNVILVVLFLTSGVRLLATLQKYSQRVYQTSRCKILYTLVIWTIGVCFEIAKYTMEVV